MSLPYTFQSEALLQTAMTVPEANLERPNNQRLEFLGDAVLSLLVAERLYNLHPTLDEGGLTEMRNNLVSGEAFLNRANRLEITELMKPHNKRTRWQSKEVIDAVEALFGAAWLDGGRPAAEALLDVLFVESDFMERPAKRLSQIDNPKGDLLQYAQVKYKTTPTYTVLEQIGPSHAPTFRCSATLLDRVAEGVATTRKKAEAEAARNLLIQLEQEA